MNQKRINMSTILQSLQDIEGVEVTSSEENKTIYVKYNTHRSLDFKFNWSKDHYIGYFLDGERSQSQAVVALWEEIEAINFATSYSLLIELRAGRK